MKEYYLNVYNKTKKELLKELKSSTKKFIITANSEIIMCGLKDETIDKILKDKNNIITADGISIIKTAKYFNIDIKEKIVGVELCDYLLKYAEENRKSVYIYGSKYEVLKLLKEKYSKVNFVGLKNGYSNKDDKIQDDIIKQKPDIIIVALGVPRQELFINDIYVTAKKGIFIGVGGSLDVLSGSKKRAPRFFQKLNIEWLYRIICEPSRIKRFWNNNIKLLFIAKKESRKKQK